MIWGLSLHSWEEIMRGALMTVGAFGLIAGVATWFVVSLQRAELAKSEDDLVKYKEDTKLKVEEAKKEGVEAGKAAGNALVRAAELEKQSAELRASNLTLEKQITPRRLSAEQQRHVAMVLDQFRGQQVIVRSYASDVESAVLATQIIQALTAAQLVPVDKRMSETSIGAIAFGVRVFGENKKLVDVLLFALGGPGQLMVSPELPPKPTISIGSGGDGIIGPATVFVAAKPIMQ